ncbi:MAG: hypothetical protein GX681_02165 [Clostridiaceae bacterium]|nr:hypothetical protein [Clostridiaceae bacterium]
MTKSIKYRFDEVMLRYVKELNLKTTTFGGYNREDVYDKIKLLLADARQVCEDVYEEAVSELQGEIAASVTKLDQAQIDNLLEDMGQLEARVIELEDTESRLKQEISDLEEKLSFYAENTEKLERANEILREARLEADRIIESGQEKGEQEVLLGRAKSREEREAALKQIEELRTKSEKLRAYLRGGEEMHRQMQAYAESYAFNDEPDSATAE